MGLTEPGQDADLDQPTKRKARAKPICAKSPDSILAHILRHVQLIVVLPSCCDAVHSDHVDQS